MTGPIILLNDVAAYLHTALNAGRYPEPEQGGIYQPFTQPVRRLGLALEPFPGLPAWVETARLDALWLHRPWQLDLAALPRRVGVLYHHRPFDETLTMGFNPYLATELKARQSPQPFGVKEVVEEDNAGGPPRPIGMLIDVPDCEFDAQLTAVSTAFGGYERAELGRQEVIARVAVVGAMTDALVREAVEQGANLYLTGQYRKPAQQAVDETGIAVIATGHRRAETWGIRALANLLHEHYPDLLVSARP
jgi:putative NIF3 family GTP cyclohydrolase 1 type 2